jgi:hypothetical protein
VSHRFNRLPRAVAVAALTAAAIATLGVPAANATPENNSTATTTDLTGSGRLSYPQPGNDIEVTVDAHGTFTTESPVFPTRAWGTFRIYHRIDQPDGKPPLVNWGDFTVDCLTVGGPTATITGILVNAGPYWQQLLGARSGLSFYIAGTGHGPSRVGLAGFPPPGQPPLSTCMAPAASAAVIRGGYTINDKR